MLPRYLGKGFADSQQVVRVYTYITWCETTDLARPILPVEGFIVLRV